MELADAIEQTFAHAQGVIANVRPDQLDDDTPCAEWTVRDLLEHMIGVVSGMGAALAGRPREDFVLGSDPAAQFKDTAASALAGWTSPGVMDRVVDGAVRPMPGRALAGINLLDTATHTWDLATATGQPGTLPDDVAIAALDASRGIVTAELRPGRFGSELDAGDGAGPTERLVAFLGRTP